MNATVKSTGCFHSREAVSIHRMEVVAGPTGRRSWPDEVKGRLVAESYRARTSTSAFARRNGIAPSQLFGWRRAAREGRLAIPVDDEDSFFTPLIVEEEEAPRPTPEALQSAQTTPAAGVVEIEAGGVTVRLPGDASAARIGEIAQALR
ncbi:MAG: transposase [Myxococcota bacterium]